MPLPHRFSRAGAPLLPRRYAALLFAALAIGCAPDPEPAPAAEDATVSSADSVRGPADTLGSMQPPPGAAGPETRVPPGPEEIYFDLTELEWYRRGEPLVHEDVPYQPAGAPVPAELAALEPAGRYQGVSYYTRAGGARADTLFVPVYPRYWLPFRPEAGREGAR